MKILNTDLMANPFNWVIITLMVVLASMGIKFLIAAQDA